MKKNIYSILLVAFIFVSSIALAIIIINKKNEDTDKNKEIVNTNKDVISNKEVSNILFSNIKYVYYDNKTEVSFVITNNNEENIKLSHFLINAYDESENLIGTIHPICDLVINAKDTLSDFSVITENDFSNAYSIKFELPELEIIYE